MPRIVLLPLCLLILSSLLSSCIVHADQEELTDYESVDLTRCLDALVEADSNKDGKIDADEHLEFLHSFGPTDYWVEMEKRPLELRAKFNMVACMCIQRGGSASCCHGDNASIDISGILDGDDASRQEKDYLETVCILTQRAIDEVERQRIEEENDTTSGTGESTSVWLRTQYEIVIVPSGSNTQTQDEVMEDLTKAMNILVEEVLEEETTQRRRRRLQEIQYLPTQVESTPTDCQDYIPEQNTCFQVSTTTYVVGPEDQLDQSELESALNDSISSGRLQELVDQVNPDSSLRVVDNVQDGFNEEEPPQVDPNTTPTDDDSSLSAGAIAGIVIAAVFAVALAAGLTYGRNRHVQLKREESKQQLQAMKQGSRINQELMLDTTSVDHVLEHDLEQGNGGGIVLATAASADGRQLSYRMDQVGVDDDALPPPLPPVDPTFVILPFAGKRPQSTKEPSTGDLEPSDNHMDYSYNSGTAFASTDRNASSDGSIGIMTPVNYSSAMGLQGVVVASSDDSSYATTSSSSSSSDSDSEFTNDESSVESSEYDKHGVMKASALEARIAEHRNSMQARVSVENVVAQSAPPTEPSNAGIIAGVTVGAAALGGAAIYAATRKSDDEDKDEPVDKTIVEASNDVDASSPPQVQSRSVPQAETNMPVHDASDGPNAGVIAGVTAGAIGAAALGGAAVYAATRDKDEPVEETTLDASQNKSARAVTENTALAHEGALGAVALGGAAVYAAPISSDEEEEMALDASKNAIASSPQAQTSSAPVVMENTTLAHEGALGAVALGGAAVYAASSSSDEEEKTTLEASKDAVVSSPPQVQSGSAPVVENNAPVQDTPNAGVIAGATAGAVGAVALGGAAIYAATRDSEDEDDKPHVGTRDMEEPPPQMQSESEVVYGDGTTTLAGIAVASATSIASIHDPVAVGEESHYHLENEDSVLGASSSSYIAAAGFSSSGTVDGPVAVGEESQMMDDPVAVGEESGTTEIDSSLSAYSSGDIYATRPTPPVAVQQPEAQYNYAFVEEDSSTMEPRSSSTLESSQALEDVTMLRPPPRPPSPTDKEPSLSTGAAVAAAGAGIVGVGATAAYLASRNHDDEDASDSVSDSASEASSDSDETSEASNGDEETNNDSQLAAASLAVSIEAPAVERPRPPASGSDHPYYAAAAAMTAGAVYEASRGTEDDDSVSSSSSSSSDSSSDSDSSSSSSSSEETTDSEYVTSSDNDSLVEVEKTAGGDVGAVTAAPVPTASASASEPVKEEMDVEPRGDHPDSNDASVEPVDGDKSLAAPNANSGTSGSGGNDTSSDVPEVGTTNGAGIPIAAAVGAGALTAAVLTSATQADKEDDESKQPDSLARDISSESTGTEGYVEISASVPDEDDGDVSIDGSSTGDVTDLATVGRTPEKESTADALLDSETLFRSVGAASDSSKSVVSDAAIVHGGSLIKDASLSSVGGGNDTEASVVPTGLESMSTTGDPVEPSASQDASLTVAQSVSASGGGTEAAVVQEQNSTTESTTLSSPVVGSAGPSPQESSGPSTAAVVAGTVGGGAALAGAAAYALGKRTSADDDSDNSTDDERTTDEESSEDEDDVTDVAVAGPRSMSRSTLATSYAGTQSASRSTLETSDSLQEGQDGSSGAFFGKDSDLSLSKSGMDSNDVVVAAAAGAVTTIDFNESSSDEDSSSSYDSDSSDEYTSSYVTNASNTESHMPKTDSNEEPSTPSAEKVDPNAMVNDSTTNVEPSETNGAQVDSGSEENSMQEDLLHDSGGKGRFASGRSGGAIMTASATLAESGDTFFAMEEAAHISHPDDVAVTKTRFAPVVSSTEAEAKSGNAVAAAVGAGALGVGAVAASATREDDETYSSSESDEDDSSNSDSFDSSSSSESSSDFSSDSSSTSSGYSTESDSSVSSNGQNTSSPEAGVKPTSALLAASSAAGTEKSTPQKQDTSITDIKEDRVGDELTGPDLRAQLKPVRSEGAITRKREGSFGSPGPGTRAQLLRAKSDALLPGSKRDESLQALLTAWDQEYDLTTGEEETTVSSDESLLVQYANAGLPPIEESGHSSGSSKDLSVAPLPDASVSENAIAASMQHGSSSLLHFDYSLRTVAEEQSGEIGHNEGDSSTSSGEEHAAALDAKFENEVVSLDLIAEHSEAMAGEGSKRNLPEVASPAEAKLSLQSSQTGETGSRSTVASEQAWESKETLSHDTSDDSSYSSSEYTTDSSDSSSSSSSDGDTDDSSSTGSTPEPSSPSSRVLRVPRSYSLQEKVTLRSLAGKRRSQVSQSVRAPSAEERDSLAESEVWAAIAAANKPRIPDEGAGDAAEWAIKRSLSALKVAQQRASSLAGSSASSSASSSDVEFSSDNTSGDDSDEGIV